MGTFAHNRTQMISPKTSPWRLKS